MCPSRVQPKLNDLPRQARKRLDGIRRPPGARPAGVTALEERPLRAIPTTTSPVAAAPRATLSRGWTRVSGRDRRKCRCRDRSRSDRNRRYRENRRTRVHQRQPGLISAQRQIPEIPQGKRSERFGRGPTRQRRREWPDADEIRQHLGHRLEHRRKTPTQLKPGPHPDCSPHKAPRTSPSRLFGDN